MTRLADFTSLHIGGQPRSFIEATTEAEIIEVVRAADAQGRELFILGGGSNVIISDDFAGDVLRIASTGIENDPSVCAGAWVTVQAGHSWDDLVATAVTKGWTGIECLSGVPGTVGATPLQNVGAYGQQVSDTIAQVRAWNRETNSVDTLFASTCEFGYRDSLLKRNPSRWVVLSVVFQFPLGTLSAPIHFDELVAKLSLNKGDRAAMTDVRSAVLELRNGKGMVLHPEDHDTWSVGSFFLNPRVSSAPDGAPAWEQSDGQFKVSAAWLIENSGFGKGFGLNSRATLSTKHTLALTNRGGATSNDILELAHHIRAGVLKTFGIELEFEPRVVN
jgi:UDP-N-acetylmuramate dehydrogenase